MSFLTPTRAFFAISDVSQVSDVVASSGCSIIFRMSLRIGLSAQVLRGVPLPVGVCRIDLRSWVDCGFRGVEGRCLFISEVALLPTELAFYMPNVLATDSVRVRLETNLCRLDAWCSPDCCSSSHLCSSFLLQL